MLKYLFKHKFILIALLVLAVAIPLLNSGLNFLLQELYDVIDVNADMQQIILLLCVLFAGWILNKILGFVNTLTQSDLMRRMNTEIKNDLFNGTINMSSYKYDTVADGEYIATFTNDMLIIEQKYFKNIIGLVSSALSIGIFAVSFFQLNPIIAGYTCIAALFAILVPFCFSGYTNRANLAYAREIGNFTQKLKSLFSSFNTVKNYGVEEQCKTRFSTVNQMLEGKKFEAEFSIAFADNVGGFFAWFMRWVCIAACIILLMEGEVTFGTILAAISFSGDLAAPIQDFVAAFNGVRSIRSIVMKNEELADNDEKAVTENKGQALACESIRYENVSLSIENSPIINNFSFEFKKGKKYLLIGRNGCGKSTLCKLLKKTYHDYEGNIFIDDKNVADISYNQLSACVSYMNENVTILYDTIKDNIILDREYEEDRLIRAIELAKIELDVNREIGDNGSKISSGEKRRIEIARTMLVDIPVLIMDEVISTLDIETAYEIEKLCLDIPDKTILFISHNFSMRLIERYDEILLIDKGALIGVGTHKELLKNNARYRDLIGIKTGEHYDGE